MIMPSGSEPFQRLFSITFLYQRLMVNYDDAVSLSPFRQALSSFLASVLVPLNPYWLSVFSPRAQWRPVWLSTHFTPPLFMVPPYIFSFRLYWSTISWRAFSPNGNIRLRIPDYSHQKSKVHKPRKSIIICLLYGIWCAHGYAIDIRMQARINIIPKTIFAILIIFLKIIIFPPVFCSRSLFLTHASFILRWLTLLSFLLLMR